MKEELLEIKNEAIKNVRLRTGIDGMSYDMVIEELCQMLFDERNKSKVTDDPARDYGQTGIIIPDDKKNNGGC